MVSILTEKLDAKIAVLRAAMNAQQVQIERLQRDAREKSHAKDAKMTIAIGHLKLAMANLKLGDESQQYEEEEAKEQVED